MRGGSVNHHIGFVLVYNNYLKPFSSLDIDFLLEQVNILTTNEVTTVDIGLPFL